ncbi:MAG: hypothetical protein IT382_09010 [Deltaproteobacteria bacterium]|nr:hypothetical protein [Deltaproteobacteria bacterium]
MKSDDAVTVTAAPQSASARRPTIADVCRAASAASDKGNDFFAEVMGDKSALPIVGSGGNGEKV